MSLDIKRKKLELSRVRVAREGLEFRIEELHDEIKRVQEHIRIQKETEIRLEKELEGK